MGFFGGKYPEKVNWKREATGIALWISLNIVDLAVTVVTMVVVGGSFVEGNPVAAWIGENIAGLVAYKIALTLVAIVLLSYLQKLHLLQWSNMVMAAVVGWNLALLCVS